MAALCGCQTASSIEAELDAGRLNSIDSGRAQGIDAATHPSCSTKEIPNELVFEHDGMTRSALVVAPSGPATTPRPVVLNFHGYSNTVGQQQSFSGMNQHARDNDYIVVYPRGTGTIPSWNAGACCGNAASSNRDDVGFVSALIDEVGAVACVDLGRVYAVGYSNGGFLSHRLACELSDRIAGIASVAGMMGIDDCEPERPIPIFQFHGTSDAVVPYEGSFTLGYRSVNETLEGWLDRYGCAETEATTFLEQGDAKCVEWSECTQPIRLCSVEGGGHTWPGGGVPLFGGKTSRDLDATTKIWEFFVATSRL